MDKLRKNFWLRVIVTDVVSIFFLSNAYAAELLPYKEDGSKTMPVYKQPWIKPALDKNIDEYPIDEIEQLPEPIKQPGDGDFPDPSEPVIDPPIVEPPEPIEPRPVPEPVEPVDPVCEIPVDTLEIPEVKTTEDFYLEEYRNEVQLIFGVEPVSVKVTAFMIAGGGQGIEIKFYDANGKLIGSRIETDSVPGGHHVMWLDKDGNRITCIPGDVNGDGEITPEDAELAHQIALGLIENPTADQLAAADFDGDGRVTMLDALDIFLISIGVDPISSKLESEDAQVRAEAIRFLGTLTDTLGKMLAVDGLIEHISQEPDADNRSLAIEIIGNIGTQEDVGLAGQINILLYSEHYMHRQTAASNLGNSGDPRAVDALIKAMQNDSDVTVRVYATYALGRIGDPRAIDVLIETMQDRFISHRIRVAAATALGMIGDSRAIDALIETMKDDYAPSSVRVAAATALGKIGDPRAIDALIETMKDDSAYTVRVAAATALGEIGDPCAMEALIETMRNDSALEVKRAAGLALVRIGERNPDKRGVVIAALSEAFFVQDFDYAGFLLEVHFELDEMVNNEAFVNLFKENTGQDVDFLLRLQAECSKYDYGLIGVYILRDNLRKLTQLYDKYGAEAAQFIFEEYNICFFGRYTMQLLSHLYEQRDGRMQGRPLALLIMCKRDPNGYSFNSLHPILMQSLLDAGYDLRIVEVGNEGELEELVKRMYDHYGEIGTLVFMAHGRPENINMVAPLSGSNDPEDPYLGLDDEDVLKSIKGYFSDNLDIVLVSCSTAGGSNDINIANFIARTLSARVFASDYVVMGANLEFGYNQDGTPFLAGVEFYGPGNNIVYDYRGYDPIPTGAVEIITSLYHNILGRDPDPAGLQNWINHYNNGMPLSVIAWHFFNSPEFQSRSLEGKISALYRVILTRDPESGAIPYWVDQYNNGMSLHEIALILINTPEFSLHTQEIKDYIINEIGILGALPTAEIITTLYHDILGRNPDPAGLQNWINHYNNGMPLSVIAWHFFNSPEFQSRSPEGKISALYRVIFDRNPGSEEVQYWVDQYNNGMSLHEIALIFINTPAFNSMNQGFKDYIINEIGILGALPTAEIITTLYHDILGRNPDPAGLQNWINHYNNGMPLSVIAWHFFNSPEFQSRSPEGKISALYRVILNRDPEPAGLQYWVGQYNSGMSLYKMAEHFLNSPEFNSKSQLFKDHVINEVRILEALRGY